jgi:hypothetical protein
MVLFILEARLGISTIAHQAVQIAILAFIFGLIFRWIHVNDPGLAREKPLPDWPPVTVERAKVTPPSRKKTEAPPPLFRLPQGGLRHTLSDGFQQDQAEYPPSATQEPGRHR